MIKSMTAFANGELFVSPIRVVTEIKSYNSRYLDISLRMTPGYGSIENHARRLISNNISRGRVEVSVQIEDKFDDSLRYDIDISKARALFKSLKLLDKTFSLGGIDLGTVVNFGNVIYPVRKDKGNDKIIGIVDTSLRSAISEMNEMKLTEGENLARDLSIRLGVVEDALMEIKAKASELPHFYKDRLRERVEKLTAGLVDVDDDRLLQEVSIMASKSDIAEEIARAHSHVRQFRTIMGDKDSVGKKLNFLLQELNREVNTMSSKVSALDISYMAVSIKSEIEKIREQVQNIE